MMPPHSCAVPGRNPGTSTNVRSGTLYASHVRTKRAALFEASMSSTPASELGWFPTPTPPSSVNYFQVDGQYNQIDDLSLPEIALGADTAFDLFEDVDDMTSVQVDLAGDHRRGLSLLALVMAFAGIDETRRLYALAIEERYRFYSFGDAMLLL